MSRSNIRKQVDQYQRERRGQSDLAKQAVDKELILISGKVRALETKEGYKSFMGAGKGATQAAAIGAAAGGALFNSAILGSAAMMKENVTYYRCKIGDIKLMGYFNYIGFKNKDQVEAVVELDKNDPNYGFVYALRKPEERKLWVIDRMIYGVNAMKEICWRFPKIIVLIFMPVIFIMYLFGINYSSDEFEFLMPSLFSLWGGALLFLIGWIGLRISFLPKARIANKIIAALGYENPEDISLAVEADKAVERWEKENEKPFDLSGPGEGFTLYY